MRFCLEQRPASSGLPLLFDHGEIMHQCFLAESDLFPFQVLVKKSEIGPHLLELR
tara:strand:+ start:461 stop:625 length:165 start_codon:yes stop_codon:yes gene_type:complete